MFPNAKAAWRINEILAFIERFDTDILIVSHISPKLYSFDWEELMTSHYLQAYDLLPFDPNFNNVAIKYNRKGFDSVQFNYRYKASYMLRLRKYSNQPIFDMSEYRAYYHIFIMSYQAFKRSFPNTESRRHVIHLYPGGGFYPADQNIYKVISDIEPDVFLLPSENFTVQFVEKYIPLNPFLAVYGSPLLKDGAIPIIKPLKSSDESIGVCFTSMGDVREKGADLYVRIAENYKQKYPNDNITFYGIGYVPRSTAIVHMDGIPQRQLDLFYTDKIDIIFNLDRTYQRNGWPLGAEAVLRGAVLFSTDPVGMNDGNNYHFRNGYVEVQEKNMEKVINLLKQYVENRTLLLTHSHEIQARAFEIFSFGTTQEPILRVVESIISTV